MTFLDLHPFDPYEARFKIIATLILLSELGVMRPRTARSPKARTSHPVKTRGSAQPARGRSRLVRPPRSC